MNDAWVEMKADGKVVASNLNLKSTSATNTPGYSIAFVSSKDISENSQIELTVTNPYSKYNANFSQNILDNMLIGTQNAPYADAFENHFLEILAALIISFLGLFTFTLAGALLVDVKYKYLTFSLVAFFGGQYILTDTLYNYFPLLINNPML